MLSFFNNTSAQYIQLASNFKFKSIDGDVLNLNDYKNKILVVVNVASRCGFTNQYEDLQNVWERYKDRDIIIIGVPTNNFRQEPGTNSEIKDFCKINFNINFPMTEKIDVIGPNAHPFYKWAKDTYGSKSVPKWNFHKIVIDKNGKVFDTFASMTNPTSNKFIKVIEKALSQ